ncbi:hypothetical protein L7F22_034004 [Adiantum nelumboides]|nr:hypothetical protein [Adiantum nelumboides]
MDSQKPSRRFASGLLAKKDEKEHFPVKENVSNHAIYAGTFYRTPIKTSCGTQAQSQTPASKLGYVSASGPNKQQPNSSGLEASEEGVYNRTPLRLLGVNKNGSLFSPSPLDRLICSPALQANLRRVLNMQAEHLVSPRRVPVKQKSNEPMNAIRQSSFLTPKKPPSAAPISNRAVHFACQKDDRHHYDSLQRKGDTFGLLGRVLACTPQRTPISASKKVGHGLTVTCQKNNLTEQHDVHVKSNVLSKRSLAFTYQQSPCTNKSSEKDVSASLRDNEVYAKHHHDTGWRDGLDKLAHLRKVLASSPHLSTPARRVPVKQKPKKLSEDASSQHSKKTPSKNVSSSKLAKASKIKQEKLKAFDARTKHNGEAKELWEDGTDNSSVDESKQLETIEAGPAQSKALFDDGVVAMSFGDSKQCDARESIDEAKQAWSDGVDETNTDELKKHNSREEGSTGAKHCGDCVADIFGKHAEREVRDKAKHKNSDDSVEKMSVVGDDSKQHDDGAICIANLSATKRLKQKCAAKVTGCSNLKSSTDKKPSKKMSSSLKIPVCSTNVKQFEEKKPKRRISSLETSKGYKTDQARVRTCKTVDVRKIGN